MNRVLIAGMGISGMATARFLHRRGLAFDSFDEHKERAEIEAGLGFGGFAHFREPGPLNEYSELIVSPGIPIGHPLIRAAEERGLAVTGEVELAYRHARGRIVAVTGSNGKSTTVSLIHHLLSGNGLTARLCGNIGSPFIEHVDQAGDSDPIYVVEVSSFQMEHVSEFHPMEGLFLNLAPDHLDRHGSFAAYRDAKLAMFINQVAGDLALAHPNLVELLPGGAQKRAVPGPWARFENDSLCVGSHFKVPLTGLNLIGRHNRINALFACAIAHRFDLPEEGVSGCLSTFKGLAHRMERVGLLQERLWINDSKATNVHAANAALQDMEMPYVLILGGCDKGDRFGGLRWTRRPRAIVAYGETAAAICEDLAGDAPRRVDRFEDACLLAHRLARPGDAVLLSPACASFDQHDGYRHRGQVFRELFEKQGVGS